MLAPTPMTRTAFAAARLVALRLTLPQRLEAAKLDDIVRDLSPLGPPQSTRRVRRLELAIRVAEAALRRARVVPDTCLYRSLARFAVLRRAGVDVRFVMGVLRDAAAGGITGHAWLESDGAPRGEKLAAEYTVTFAYPP